MRDAERHAQLIAAADALIDWVQARRAAWALEPPLPVAQPVAAPPSVVEWTPAPPAVDEWTPPPHAPEWMPAAVPALPPAPLPAEPEWAAPPASEPESPPPPPAVPEWTPAPLPAEPEWATPPASEPESTPPPPAAPEWTPAPLPAEPEWATPPPSEPEWTVPPPAAPEWTPLPGEPEWTAPSDPAWTPAAAPHAGEWAPPPQTIETVNLPPAFSTPAASALFDPAFATVAENHGVVEPSPRSADEGAPKRFVLPPFPTHLFSRDAPLVRWSLRIVAAAAVVAIAIGAGVRARTYLPDLKPKPKIGTAIIESVPPGSDVLVDGSAVGRTPLTIELVSGHHVLELRRRNATRQLEVEIAAGQSTRSRLDWTAKAVGRLQVQSTPDGARVLVDGKPRGTAPLTLEDVTVGSHVIVLQSDKGSVRRTVSVAAGATAELSESIFPGWIKVFAPFEVKIFEGTRELRLDEQSQLLLPPGSHELRFENKEFAYGETERVEIEPGKVAPLTLSPSASRLNVTATAPAEVFVDGERVGETPLVNQPISLGTREIVVKNAAAERRLTVTVTSAPLHVDVDFSKP